MDSLGFDDVFLRLFVAVVSGAIIGLDREVRDKPAGLRTMSLVSLGSAVFVLASLGGDGADNPLPAIQGIDHRHRISRRGHHHPRSVRAGGSRPHHRRFHLARLRTGHRLQPGRLAARLRRLRPGPGRADRRAVRAVDQGEIQMSGTDRRLDIDEDLNFQRREWSLQRVGIGILFLFVLAALLGLTGMGGPLSHGEAGERGGAVFVEFERFVRRGTASTIKLHLRASPGDVRVFVSAPYFEHVRIESVAPEPELVTIEAARHVYLIRMGSSEAIVTLQVDHRSYGTLEAEVGLVDGPSVRFTQLALF